MESAGCRRDALALPCPVHPLSANERGLKRPVTDSLVGVSQANRMRSGKLPYHHKAVGDSKVSLMLGASFERMRIGVPSEQDATTPHRAGDSRGLNQEVALSRRPPVKLSR